MPPGPRTFIVYCVERLREQCCTPRLLVRRTKPALPSDVTAMRSAALVALLYTTARAVIVVRQAAPDELLRVARFRAAAFSSDGRTASPARAQAVHKLVEDRVARGSTLLCALASGEDAACLEEETEGDGWHPGLETSQPMKLFQSFFKSEPGATLEESLDDCRIVGVCDVSRHEFDLPTHALAPDFGLYLTALAGIRPCDGAASRLPY